MIDSAIYQALAGDVTINDNLKVGQRIYPAGALGVDDIPAEPQTPFIQFGFDTNTPYAEVRETGGSMRHMLRISVYDDRGTFSRIRAIHYALRQTIEGLTGQTDADGWQCTDAQLMTLGGDLTDNVRNRGVKQASYRIVGK